MSGVGRVGLGGAVAGSAGGLRFRESSKIVPCPRIAVCTDFGEFGGIPDFGRRAMPFDVDCKSCTYARLQKKCMGLRGALDWNEVEF